MDDTLLRQYAITIANSICSMSRTFGPTLDRWDFKLVQQPKVPFANELTVPNVTFTYKLNDEESAIKVLELLYDMLYGQKFNFKDSDHGVYLICYILS